MAVETPLSMPVAPSVEREIITIYNLEDRVFSDLHNTPLRNLMKAVYRGPDVPKPLGHADYKTWRKDIFSQRAKARLSGTSPSTMNDKFRDLLFGLDDVTYDFCAGELISQLKHDWGSVAWIFGVSDEELQAAGTNEENMAIDEDLVAQLFDSHPEFSQD